MDHDWITAEGRRKLAAAGIAPPSAAPRRTGPVPLTLGRPASPPLPALRLARTRLTAQFSATACKSLHRCDACGEPFEAVKATDENRASTGSPSSASSR